MTGVRFLLVSALVLVSVIALYSWYYPSGTLRYEMVVEVEADGETYRGSSVLEAEYIHEIQIGDSTFSSHSRGEAIVVDIGDRGTLFVLVTGPHGCPDSEEFASRRSGADPENIPSELFDLRVDIEDNVRRLRQFEGYVEVPLNRMPLMVRFDDITDPLTVSQVDPCDLAASFGEGVHLGSVTIEATHAPVTTGIEERLSWLEVVGGGYLDGSFSSNSNNLSNSLHGGNFKRGS